MTCKIQTRRGRPTGFCPGIASRKNSSEGKKGYVTPEESKDSISNGVKKYWNGKGIRKGAYKFVTHNGKQVPEHRAIAEMVLGRPLKKSEVVHHINGKCYDNRNCNLVIMNRSDHSVLHHKLLRQSKMKKEISMSPTGLLIQRELDKALEGDK